MDLRRYVGNGWDPAHDTGIVFDFDHPRLSSTPPPEAHTGQEAFRFDGGVLASDPPERLVLSRPEADGASSTTVEVTLRRVRHGEAEALYREELSDA